MLINMFIIYYNFGSMPIVNVIQITVYEIYSLSVSCFFLQCKTKRENVQPLAIKFIRHQKNIQRILYCSCRNVTFFMMSSGNKCQYLFSLICLHISITVLNSERNTKENFLKKIHDKLSLDFDYKQQICECG